MAAVALVAAEVAVLAAAVVEEHYLLAISHFEGKTIALLAVTEALQSEEAIQLAPQGSHTVQQVGKHKDLLIRRITPAV